MSLTVVILTKNEEANIAEVIKNSKLVTEYVLIVDSGSTDKTVELAKANGAEVVYRAWDNDFSAQRNFALEHVHTDWVLYLDADERLDSDLCIAIKKAISTEPHLQHKWAKNRRSFRNFRQIFRKLLIPQAKEFLREKAVIITRYWYVLSKIRKIYIENTSIFTEKA